MLAQRLRRRDSAALEEVSGMYGTALTRAAWVYLGDEHAAADAVQETLMAAWDGARKLRQDASLRPWLFGMLFNRCRKHQRAATRRRRREEKARAGRAQGAAEPGFGRAEALHKALAGLEDETRRLVVLRYLEDMSVAETAAALGIPEGTVKSRSSAALAKLRRLLEDSHD